MAGIKVAMSDSQVIICNQDGQAIFGMDPDMVDEFVKQLVNAASQIRTGRKIIDAPDSIIIKPGG